MKFILYIVILLFISITNPLFSQNYSDGKSDFVIEDVSCKVTYLDGHDQTGMPVRYRYKVLRLSVKIKNVGTKDFSGILYLARTNTKDDALLNLYSKYILLEPSPLLLKANSIIKVKIKCMVGRALREMRFKINEYSNLEMINEESDYFNNTFILKF
jgi:hypothetical protein